MSSTTSGSGYGVSSPATAPTTPAPVTSVPPASAPKPTSVPLTPHSGYNVYKPPTTTLPNGDTVIDGTTYFNSGPYAGRGYSRGGLTYVWNGNGYSVLNESQSSGTSAPSEAGSSSTTIPQTNSNDQANNSAVQQTPPSSTLEPTLFQELDTKTAQEILSHTKLKSPQRIFELQISPTIDDNITNFDPKTSLLVFDKDELIGAITSKPTLKVAKSQDQAEKLQGSSTTFIYRQDTGELLLNANQRAGGLGEDGGVVATFENRPRITIANISFYSFSG